MATVIIFVIILLICIYAIKSYTKKLQHGCCGSGGDEVKRIRPADGNVAHYPYARKIEIEGMSCKNCAIRIENAFQQREGFLAEVYLKHKNAVVWMKQPTSDKELKEIIERTGYTVGSIEEYMQEEGRGQTKSKHAEK